MAKNDAKTDKFLKSDEVVFLPDVGTKDCADKPLSSNLRRSIPTRSTFQIHRSAVETSKFPNTQTKMPQLPKSPVVIPVTYTVPTSPSIVCSPRVIAPAIKCDSVLISGPVVPSPVAVVQRQVKPNQTRSLSQYLNKKSEERTISIYSDKARKYIVPNQMKTENSTVSSNGQIMKQVNAGRRPSIPADLTITPIRDSSLSKVNTIVESSKVVSKPTQTFIGTPVQPLTKSTDVKDKELSTALSPSTSVFQKETFYSKPTQGTSQVTNSDPCFRHNVGRKVIILTDAHAAPTRGRPRGSRNKVAEPVCLTLSSDDEEPGDEHNNTTVHNSNSPSMLLQQCTTRDSSVNTSQVNDGTKMEVNSFGKQKSVHFEMNREEEDDELDESMVEDEEVEEEEEAMDTHSDQLNGSSELMREEVMVNNVNAEKQLVILCRSVRIGSFKIHPVDESPHISVLMNSEGFKFKVPTVKSVREMTNIVLKESDIQQALGHFGRCLPILFIFTTAGCGDRIRKQLHMSPGDMQYFDPEGQDDRQKIITFLIDSISEENRHFLRHCFPGENVLKEVDQKLANEILVKSTPQHTAAGQNVIIKNTPLSFTQITHTTLVQNSAPPVVQATPVKATPTVPQSQVTKLLTYPPPPQTGGIAITSEDMLCLDEGEFLNDAIIDFYLKYLMNEKLTEKDRKRTHIFSSFFYPRLTQRTTRNKSGDDASSSTSVRRHTQVKTWTKNVDIFEKDFIIIPINQNVHWFLAIICFPGLVPDCQNLPPKNNTKCTESVSSTNEGESSENPEVSQINLPVNSLSPGRSMKDQSCSTDGSFADQSSDDGNSLSNEVESSLMEEPIPDAPDSSTHPDRNAHHERMPCILIFDSLSGPNRWRIVHTLREYLDMEWKIKKNTSRVFSKTTMRGHVTTVPQQTNYSDCGIYVLQYVESFFENPFPYFADHMPQLPDWFPPEKVANKRQEIKDLIGELQIRQTASAAARQAIARKDTTDKVLSVATSTSSSLQTNRLPTS